MSDLKVLMHKKVGNDWVPVTASDFSMNSFGSLTGKPTTLAGYGIVDAASLNHNHVIGDITNLQATLNSKAALSHSHAQSEVTGLVTTLSGMQTSINGKAATSHSHSISEITNLSASLLSLQDGIDSRVSTLNFNTGISYVVQRANHTGTQEISTINGLQEALSSTSTNAPITLSDFPQNDSSPTLATGFLTVVGNVSEGDSLQVGNVTYIFKNLPSYEEDILISPFSSGFDLATAIEYVINNDINNFYVNAVRSGQTIFITAKNSGESGNTTLSSSSPSIQTSGSTLTGGLSARSGTAGSLGQIGIFTYGDKKLSFRCVSEEPIIWEAASPGIYYNKLTSSWDVFEDSGKIDASNVVGSFNSYVPKTMKIGVATLSEDRSVSDIGAQSKATSGEVPTNGYLGIKAYLDIFYDIWGGVSEGDKLVVNGVDYTFVNEITGAYQLPTGGGLADVGNVSNAFNSSPTVGVVASVLNESSPNPTLRLTASEVGVAGNSITVSSTAPCFPVAMYAHLAHGVDQVGTIGTLGQEIRTGTSPNYAWYKMINENPIVWSEISQNPVVVLDSPPINGAYQSVKFEINTYPNFASETITVSVDKTNPYNPSSVDTVTLPFDVLISDHVAGILTKARAALNNDWRISDFYTISSTGNNIILTSKVATENDPRLEIYLSKGTKTLATLKEGSLNGPYYVNGQIAISEGNVYVYTSSTPATWNFLGNVSESKEQTLSNKTFSGITKNIGHTTVSGLPSASSSGAGARAFVTNATNPTFMATVVGGGSIFAPVFSNGTNWIVG